MAGKEFRTKADETIATGDQVEAERVSQQGCRQITAALRKTFMGSRTGISTPPVRASATPDQQTDYLSIT